MPPPRPTMTAMPATVDISTTQPPIVKNGDPVLDALCVENDNNRHHNNMTVEAVVTIVQ